VSDTTLLPSNASPYELALEGATQRIDLVPLMGRVVWNPQTCPSNLLPWLAWSLGVNEWDSNWPDATKRAVIANSAALHKIKGTPQSIINALSAAGFPGATIVEKVNVWKLDGSRLMNGLDYFGDPTKWAWYRISLPMAISNSQAQQVERILAATAPARCYLQAFDFTEAAFILDGSVQLNGTYNMGTVS
jgi:phage tail P2-like protein